MVAFVVIIYLERKFGILYIFYIQILYRKYSDIQKYSQYIQNVHQYVCIFLMQYMWNLFRSCMDMHIMYRLTTTFLLLLQLADPWVLFIPLLRGFGVWSFCSASPYLTGLSLSNCWCTAHRVPSLPICTCSLASCAMKSFRAGKKEKI